MQRNKVFTPQIYHLKSCGQVATTDGDCSWREGIRQTLRSRANETLLPTNIYYLKKNCRDVVKKPARENYHHLCTTTLEVV